MKSRYLSSQIEKDLKKKMVFVGGPRQVGKTTLATHLAEGAQGYLNWDIPEHREAILRREFPTAQLWIFDEIHKYRGWRNLLKGLYDQHKEKRQILVTGSARLDYYRFGGDSLQGRYHYLRLHPFSFAELKMNSASDLQELLKLSGFPEPFLGKSEEEAKRWSREYRNRLFREDLTSLERVQDLGRLEHLMLRLPELVGSPLSLNALREDLQISHKTVSNWVDILERLYAVFRIPPFGAPKIRAVKKERKHYHFDWSLVPDLSLRFENLVASHLLKWSDFEADCRGREIEVRYFRDIDGREVDFVLTENKQPFLMVECKWSDVETHSGLKYLKARFQKCEAWQISATGRKDFISPEGIRVCPATKFLKRLV